MRELLKACRALSDETRLRILSLLLERECCVCEVMEALDISQTRASRNINILHDAGFLTHRKEGLWSMYSIEREDIEDYLLDLIEAMKAGLVGNEQVDLDRQRLMNMERIGPNNARCFRKECAS